MFCFRFPELVSDSFQLKSFKENLVFSFHEALTWNIWISKEMTFVKSVCAWVTYICMGSQHVLGIWFHCWNFKRTSFVLNHWGTDGPGLTLVSCPTRLSSISTSREQIYQSNVLGIRDVAIWPTTLQCKCSHCEQWLHTLNNQQWSPKWALWA